jgi:hypothetical protein
MATTREKAPEEARGASGKSVSIALDPRWDAALSYDVLEQDNGGDAPIFVGRKELLGPIVNAIGYEDRRGTYLISGYRGAGKTSLVIAAALQARAKLEADPKDAWTLVPVVLNVSEVSASLSDSSATDATALQIDARRLLTALLRGLRNKLRKLQKDEPELDSLASDVDRVYHKADASQYTERSRQADERLRREAIESKLSVNAPNLLKVGAGLAALGFAGVEGGFLLWPFGAGVHVIAAALAGIAVVAYAGSRTVSRSTQSTDTSEIELVRDNSIHQLETDLKEIFSRLREKRLRTIVVLEELDKVEDKQGKQLDAVIRYFKNLFTQAPALFFFLTDKEYYDLIARKIDESRKKRTYSVEHTFFTHRVFVNRPGIHECLQYLGDITTAADEKAAIAAIVESEKDRIRPLEEMDLRERLIRVLLFRAQGHIFDLKNELAAS